MRGSCLDPFVRTLNLAIVELKLVCFALNFKRFSQYKTESQLNLSPKIMHYIPKTYQIKSIKVLS